MRLFSIDAGIRKWDEDLIRDVRLKAHSQVRDNFGNFESPLKMMKNALYFTLKALLVLKIFKFLSWNFSQIEKRFN